MSDENALDRSEAATPRRLEQAREEGQVVRSQELTTFWVLAAGVAALWLTGSHAVGRLGAALSASLNFSRHSAFEPDVMAERFVMLVTEGLLVFAPVGIAATVAALTAPALVNGWAFSTNALALKLERINPLQGCARMCSVESLMELGKALAKTAVIGTVVVLVIWHQRDTLLGLTVQPLESALAQVGSVAASSIGMVVAAMLAIVAIDVPMQIWNHHRRLRMTKEEIRREARETDGDPQVKGRIRSLQREAARRRMMTAVPDADVVVTNPTHFAVALRYDAGAMRAPRVVAKGAGMVAARIREIASAHGVPLLEAPPLARALYRHSDVDDEVPQALYAAVAEVLAYVYQLRRFSAHGGRPPEVPHGLDVPPALDPPAAS